MIAACHRTVACAAVFLSLATTSLIAQDTASTPRARIAPPGLAARLGLMPLVTTNVPGFRSANPTFDGRGVLIGILDSGLDPSIPGLLQTTTGDAKIVDLRDFSGEGRMALSAAVVSGDSIIIGTSSLAGASAWRDKAAGTWFGAQLRERVLGEMPAADLNGDGDDEDLLPVLVVRINGEWAVLVDRDGDGSLANDLPIRDYLVAREHFSWARPGAAGSLALAVNFAEVPGQEAPALDLYFDTSAHGSHVAGIAAGHDIYGVAGFDGVAPGAWLLGLKISDNAQGGITTSGSMARALGYAVRFAKERRLPLVLNMSFGVGNELEGRARIDAIVDSVLEANPGIVFTISAGNDGPGLSTLGFPGSASRAISVGATMPAIFRPGAEGPGAQQEPVASFSSRGGELAKPDIVTPGVAYATVPVWNTGDEIKGGTSMASPHAAGLAARLVSGLAQRSLPIDAERIRLALQASARRVPGADVPDEGAGRPDLLKAWTWLTTPHDVEPLTVRLNGSTPGTSALLRRGGALAADSTISFTLLRYRAGPARRLKLASASSWLSVPPVVVLEGDSVTVPVIVRAGAGAASAVGTVVVTAESDTSAGPLARLAVTLLAPAAVGTPFVLEAPLHGVGRIGVPSEQGRAFGVEIVSEGPAAGADVHFYEPDGQPWRDGHSQALSEDAEEGTQFVVSGRDASTGLYELVLRAADAGPAKATVTVRASPISVTGASRTGSVLTVNGRSFGPVPATGLTASLVGAQRVLKIEARGGLSRRTPIVVPSWVRRIVVDAEMPRAQWSRFTDFGVTLFDAEGRQLGKEPMNYPTVRLEIGELPDSSTARTVVLGLFPGMADPADEGAWTATVTMRFYGEDETLLRSAPGAAPKSAPGTAQWRFALPTTAGVPMPDEAVALLRIAITTGGFAFEHELAMPAAAPASRGRAVAPARARRP